MKKLIRNPLASIMFATLFFLAIVLSLTQCDRILPCQKHYVIILLTLKCQEDQPVQLDSCQIFWVDKSRILEKQHIVDWNHDREHGRYVVVDDGMKNELRNKRATMRFTGYLNGEIVHQQDVRVSANHCHVEYIGKEPLVQVVELNF